MSPSEDPVEETPESLIRSYPQSAVEIPNVMFDNGDFQFGLANFLSRPDTVDSDAPLPPPTDPQHINALLNGVLESVGRAADVPRGTKRVYVLRQDVWWHSNLWFLVRVAIQIVLLEVLPTMDSCCSSRAPLQVTKAIQPFPVIFST